MKKHKKLLYEGIGVIVVLIIGIIGSTLNHANSPLALLQRSAVVEYGEPLPDLKQYVDVSKYDDANALDEITYTIDGEEEASSLDVGKHKVVFAYRNEKKDV